MTWWQIFMQECTLLIKKDPRRIIFIIGAPIAYLFLFGLLYSPQIVNHIPIAICDEDQTPLSRAIIQQLSDSERLNLVAVTNNEFTTQDLFNQNITTATVYIPQNFSQQIKTGISSKILLTVDGSNLISTNTLLTTIQPIIADTTANVSAQLLNTNLKAPTNALGKVMPVQLQYRVLHNQNESYLYFFLIGLAMAAFQQGIFLSTGASFLAQPLNIPDNRYRSLFYHFSAKLTPYFLSSIFAFALTIYTAIHYFNLPNLFSFIELSALGVAFTCAAIAFTLLLSSFIKSELIFTRCSIIYTVPAFILSGYIWPYQSMSLVSKLLSYLFPITYLSSTCREIILTGTSPNTWSDVLVLNLICLICTCIGLFRYKKTLAQA
ncbi:ABC transporter permease [Anaerosinus sp.]|uniref:ABC transporter permease n=1 Tax=Selenobaculum sp. TaxID=3074374 RepID=UPI003AB36D9B